MSRRFPLIALLVLFALWLAGSYGLRYALMEDAQWVGLCVEDAQRWECQLRAGLGLLIHHRVIALGALALALVAFFLPGRAGWRLGVLGMLVALPAMVLYSASIGVFAVVIAALRLVRRSAGAPATA